MIAAADQSKHTNSDMNLQFQRTNRNCEIDATQNTEVKNSCAETTLVHEPGTRVRKAAPPMRSKAKKNIPDIRD